MLSESLLPIIPDTGAESPAETPQLYLPKTEDEAGDDEWRGGGGAGGADGDGDVDGREEEVDAEFEEDNEELEDEGREEEACGPCAPAAFSIFTISV